MTTFQYIQSLFSTVHVSLSTSSDEEIVAALRIIQMAEELTSAEISTLKALYKYGVLDDGDVASKAGRDALVEKGLAVRTIQKGEYGFNACTYKGGYIFSLLVSKGVIED